MVLYKKYTKMCLSLIAVVLVGSVSAMGIDEARSADDEDEKELAGSQKDLSAEEIIQKQQEVDAFKQLFLVSTRKGLVRAEQLLKDKVIPSDVVDAVLHELALGYECYEAYRRDEGHRICSNDYFTIKGIPLLLKYGENPNSRFEDSWEFIDKTRCCLRGLKL